MHSCFCGTERDVIGGLFRIGLRSEGGRQIFWLTRCVTPGRCSGSGRRLHASPGCASHGPGVSDPVFCNSCPGNVSTFGDERA